MPPRRRLAGNATPKPNTMTSRLLAAPITSLLFALGTSITKCAASSSNSNVPSIDLAALGSVGVIGSFAGLELYDKKTSFVAPSSSNSSANQADLLLLDSQGLVTRLGATNSGDSSISAIVQCGSKDDLYVGGQFTDFGGASAQNIAVIYALNGSVSTLGQGLDGPVTALACDEDKLYVGGSFTRPVGSTSSDYLGKVATWDTATSAWSAVGFGGFSGASSEVSIDSISVLTSSDSKSLLFGGAFQTFWLDETATASQNITVSTLTNGTIAVVASNSTSNVQTGGTVQVFSSLGSSLLPIPLSNAEILSSQSSSNTLYNDSTVVFCPAGDDGSQYSTWLGADNTQGKITVRMFTPLEVGGFRLGNTFVDGRGTETFSITAIPSNEVLTLQYRDDPTASSSTVSTCSSSCPLKHDSSINYEDFIISSSNRTTTITGFEINLSTYYGSSAGLHLLQLLSSGSVSYAIDNQNIGYGQGQGICASGSGSVYGRSSSSKQPTAQIPWDHHEVASSSVSGTSEGMLCAPTPVDTDPEAAPTMTWYPYVTQDGTYELYYFTPACAFDATCGQRGNVDVTVQIDSTNPSTTTTTVNQEVTFDTSTLVYSGAINPISSNDQVTVTMSMSATQPTLADGFGDKYYFIADKITVIAKDTDGNGSNLVKVGTGLNAVNSTNTGNITSTGEKIAYTTGYGLWEYVVRSSVKTSSPTVNTHTSAAQQVASISTASNFDQIGLKLSPSAHIAKIIVTPDNANTIIVGDFNYTSSNSSVRSVLAIASATTTVTGFSGGLAGSISDAVILDDWLYVVGTFNATVDGVVANLNGRARTQYPSGQWEALSGLSNTGSPQTVTAINGNLLFTFDHGSTEIWIPANAATLVDAKSLVVGSFDVGTTANNDSVAYLAGSLDSLSRFRSNGMARLTEDGIVSADIAFDFTATSSESATGASTLTTTTAVPSRRAISDSASSVISAVKNKLRKRQSAAPAAPTSLPLTALDNSTDPKILAGAYWTNTSDSQTEITIVGGHFVSSDQTVQNLALLSETGELYALPGAPLVGIVRTLQVMDDILWVGGSFTVSSSSSPSNLATYDLSQRAWVTLYTGNPTSSSSSSVVYDIQHSNGDLIVAGHFDSIGSTACKSICTWSKDSQNWKNLGEGLNGVVGSVAVSTSSVFAAGSFVINNTSTYVVYWSYETSTWASLPSDGVPGPAAQVVTDTPSNLFLYGTASSGTNPYILRWNGSSWSDASQTGSTSVETTLSDVHQIALVPLLGSLSSSGDVFSSGDRALLLSGQLVLSGFGQVSSAIYTGRSWYPHLMSSTLAGGAGTIAKLIYSNQNVVFSHRHHLAVGLVILISMAVALGIVFLGVLVSLIVVLSTKREDPQMYPIVIPPFETKDFSSKPTSPTPFLSGTEEKRKSKSTHPPTSMLETLNAATTGAILSAGHPTRASSGLEILPGTTGFAGQSADETSRSSRAPTSSDDDEGSVYDDIEEGDDSLPLRGVRYSFEAERDEELSINTGDMVEVLDESDEHWHIVQRMRDGRQGLVPSTFLT